MTSETMQNLFFAQQIALLVANSMPLINMRAIAILLDLIIIMIERRQFEYASLELPFFLIKSSLKRERKKM